MARKRPSGPEGAGRRASSSHSVRASRPKKKSACSCAERFEAAVGAAALDDRHARPEARLDAPDAADEPVKRLFVVERSAELDPCRRDEEGGQTASLGPFRPRQKHRDDTEPTFVHAAVDGGPHLLVLPCAKAAGTDEYGAGGAGASASSMGFCQGSPGTKFHLSSQGSIPSRFNRRARSSIAGLSALLWERKTSRTLVHKSAMVASALHS